MFLKEHDGLTECLIDIGQVNAFAQKDIHDFNGLLTLCEQAFSSSNRILVLKSCKISPSGFPIFCAGANQKERVEWSCEQILAHVAFQRSVIHRLRTLPQLVICCVNGLALGLGTEICLASDVVMASENAAFAFPEKNWGIIPGAGGYSWAHAFSKNRDEALKLIESAERISREKAEKLGIVDILCSQKDFSFKVAELLEQLKSIDLCEQVQNKKRKYEKIDFSFLFEQEQQAYAHALALKNRK